MSPYTGRRRRGVRIGTIKMTKKVWFVVGNSRPRMHDGVKVIKEDNSFTVYRYDDWDEDGDSIYSTEEYLKRIPEQALKNAIKASSDSEVVKWIRAHLIKEESNSLDAIIEFLKDSRVLSMRQGTNSRQNEFVCGSE